MENDEIKEEDILAGIGIHVIAKLSGKAVASREESLHKCPCGCNKNLPFGDKMYIGNLHMSHIMRKPVFGVSDQVRHKLGCTASEDC